MSTMQQPTQSLYQKLQATSGDLTGLVNAAGQELGLPEGQMYRIGMVESSLKAEAKNKRSTATGLYQFTKGTWNEVITKYGPQYGIPEGTSAKDPVANAILGAAYLNENATKFKETYGKDPELTDLYMGHFLGQNGRRKFLDAMASNPNAPAAMFTSKRQVNSNPEVFFNEDGSAATLAEVYKRFGDKLGAAESTGEHIASGKADIYVDAIRERMMDREFLGQDSQLDIERAVVAQGDFGLPTSGSKSFADTVSDYGLAKPEVEEERGFFDGSWDAAKAELRLSSAGRFVREKMLEAGLPVEWDPAAAQVAAAFGEMSPQEMLQYDPTKEYTISDDLWKKIFDSGIDKKWAQYIKTAYSHQDLINKVQLASEMQKADKARNDAATGGQLVGGVVGALGDPLTFAGSGAVKAGTIGGRMFVAGTEGAIGNVASELGLEQETQGAIEMNTKAAALGGFVAGSSLRGLGDAFSNFGASIRMRARQEALDAGLPDNTARPDIEVPEGRRFAELPDETGAVVDELGNTHSATSIGNPKIQEEAEMEHLRANKGIELGQANMLSYALLRSESNEVRGIAADLVRSPTGIQGGGSGKTSMTAEDVLGRLEGMDNAWYTKASTARDAAYQNSMFDLSGRRGALEDMERSVVEAIESGDLSKLSKEQQEYAKTITELYVRKFEEGTNPSMFGNPDAPSVFASTRDASKYVPQVFEEGKVNAAKNRFGGEEGWEGLQDAIKNNWRSQWKANHNDVRERFRETYSEELNERLKAATSKVKEGEQVDADKVLNDLAEEYIEKKSYGISRNGDFTHAASLEDANLDDSLVGIENNNFTMERNVFDSAFRTIAQDKQPFSINDLRHFDLMNIAQMYNRRMNGDVAIHAATGKDTKALKDTIVNLPEGKDKHNLDQLVRLITGRARADNTAPAFNALMRGLQDISFASNNAQMWLNNLTEVSGWATNRIMFMARNGVPAVKQLFNPETKFTKADLKDFRMGIFGKEINDALQPSYHNVRDSLVRQGVSEGTAGFVAGVRMAGSKIATGRANIYTRMLNGTQELLTGMARSGVLADITQEAFGGVRINPATLKNASVTPDQYRGILEMLREHVKVVDGEFKPDVAAIRRDPRTNDLWRLADYIASDSVMRTGKVGMNYVMRPNSMMNLALQFKSFMLKGLNARTVRLFHEMFHGKAIDNVVRVIVGTGLTGAIWSMTAHYRSLGIPENERRAYLEKMLDPGMVAYQSLSRQAELGPLLGAVNLALTPTGMDIFKAGRSTVDPRSVAQGDPLRANITSMESIKDTAGQAVYDMFPSARTLAAPVVMQSSLFNWAQADYGYQSDMQLRSFYEALGSLAPNAPEVQWFINQMAEEAGASGKFMK